MARSAKPALPKCSICEDPVAPERQHPKATSPAHQICFDISIANLAAELESYCDSHPERYEKVRDGVYREITVTE